MEGSLIVERLKRESGRTGYDVAKGEFADMIKAGIVDPTKVTRLALQNAASVAGLLLTTEAIVVEKREKRKAAMPAPGGADPHARERQVLGLADVVRIYLESRYQVPAPRQTSAEYCRALARSEHLPEEQINLLGEFLRRCDLPKFAPLDVTPEECLQTLALARRFLELDSADQVAGAGVKQGKGR